MFGSYFIVENRDLVRKNGFFTCCQTGNFLMCEGNVLKEKQGIFKRNFKKSTFLKVLTLLKKAEV